MRRSTGLSPQSLELPDPSSGGASEPEYTVLDSTGPIYCCPPMPTHFCGVSHGAANRLGHGPTLDLRRLPLDVLVLEYLILETRTLVVQQQPRR
jgi:hypothetical protein